MARCILGLVTIIAFATYIALPGTAHANGATTLGAPSGSPTAVATHTYDLPLPPAVCAAAAKANPALRSQPCATPITYTADTSSTAPIRLGPCGPGPGCSGTGSVSSCWANGFCVYDSDNFYFTGTMVYDQGESNSTSGCCVQIQWHGCSPTSSNSYIGCGSDFRWQNCDMFGCYHVCASQRVYEHVDGSTNKMVYNPHNC